jgi:hypothetical protein
LHRSSASTSFGVSENPRFQRNRSGTFIAFKTQERNLKGQKMLYRTQIIFDDLTAGKR